MISSNSYGIDCTLEGGLRGEKNSRGREGEKKLVVRASTHHRLWREREGRFYCDGHQELYGHVLECKQILQLLFLFQLSL